MKKAGYTIVELLLVVGIMSFALVGMISVIIQSSLLAEMSTDMTKAVAEAQDKVEEIRDHEFDDIVEDFTVSCVCADGKDNDGDSFTDYGEDAECQSMSDSSESNGSSTDPGVCRGSFTVSTIDGSGAIYIEPGNEELLVLDVVVSWQNRDGRVIGEDLNLNGTLDAGEDADSSGRLNSSVQLSTYVTRK